MPTFGSLFAGIGGIDLGLERAGWTGRWQVEWDPYCQHVLAHHWPDVARVGDIHDAHGAGACPDAAVGGHGRDGRGPVEVPARPCSGCLQPVDLIAGGFPCQPVSAAGKQRAQADARWLWPEFARVVRELRPRYVLVENVRNLLAVNDGTAFGEVLGDLAALGYDAEWHVISAADVGAPHLRERVWIVGRQVADADGGRLVERDARQRGVPEPDSGGALAHPIGERGRGWDDDREHAADADAPGEGVRPGGDGEWWAVEPDVGDLADGLSTGLAGHWDVEPPDVPRVARNIPHRVDQLRALGNAVVPPVVEMIGRSILDDFTRH